MLFPCPSSSFPSFQIRTVMDEMNFSLSETVITYLIPVGCDKTHCVCGE